MTYRGIEVKADNGISEKELRATVDNLIKQHPDKQFKTITLSIVDEDFVCATYSYENVEFERIRRITGYLVGTLDRFNDAKRAEEKDRVNHSLI